MVIIGEKILFIRMYGYTIIMLIGKRNVFSIKF